MLHYNSFKNNSCTDDPQFFWSAIGFAFAHTYNLDSCIEELLSNTNRLQPRALEQFRLKHILFNFCGVSR